MSGVLFAALILLGSCGDNGPTKNDIAYAVAKATHRDLNDTQKGMAWITASCSSIASQVFECKLVSSNMQLAEEFRTSWMRFKKTDGEWSMIAMKSPSGIWQTAPDQVSSDQVQGVH